MKTEKMIEGIKIRAETKRPGAAGKFWNFVNDAESDTATLQLFGTIASEESWWSEDNTTYQSFIRELNALGDKKMIRVEINSGGGDVFAANAIYTALLTNQADIEGYVLGICASAATIVLMACGTRKIAVNGLLMTHNPKLTLYGAYESEDLLKMSEITDKVKESIKNAYKTRLGKTDEELNKMMNEETWLVGMEAVDQGFCTGLIEEKSPEDWTNSTALKVTGNLFQDSGPYMGYAIPDNVLKKVTQLTNAVTGGGAFFNKKSKNGGQEVMDNENHTEQIENVEQLRAAYPALCQQIEAAGAAEERERLKEIDQIANGIPADMLEKARYTAPVTAEALSFAVMKANNSAGQSQLSSVVEDLKNSGAAGVGAVPTDGVEDREDSGREEKINRLAAALKNDKRRK